MSVQLRDKIDEQNKLWNRMQEIQRVSEDEKRDWTAEERTNWDEANTRIDVVSADIERLERMASLGEVDFTRSVAGKQDDAPVESPEDRTAAREKQYDTAFRTFMRRGNDGLTTEQRQLMLNNSSETRDQGIGTPSAGGYLVPPGYRTVMTEALKAYGGLINLANVITTSTGQPLQWPTNDDTGNVGAILAENTQITTQDVTIGTRSIGAYTYTSKLVRVSLQLLQDSAFDIDTWLPRKLGQRIGRAVANDLVNGTGVGQPTGILPGAVSWGGTALTAANFNTGGAASQGYDALIELEHSVDPAYRQLGRCRFLLSDMALRNVRKYKDTQARPLYLPVPVPGQPATINGNPFTIDQAMPTGGGNGTFVATNRPVLFGDFFEGMVVRQALDVQAVRLAERYADFLQVGFFGFIRVDAVPDDANAVRALVLT